MANLTIKDLSDEVHRELKNAARAEGKSLNAYIASLLRENIDERRRRELMRASRVELRRFADLLPPMADSSVLIRRDRERGH